MLMLRPDLNIPHRTYIRSHLTSLYESVQSKLLLDLPESAKVSIALDGWQSPVMTATEVGVRAIQDHKVIEWNTCWKCRLSGGTDDM